VQIDVSGETSELPAAELTTRAAAHIMVAAGEDDRGRLAAISASALTRKTGELTIIAIR
jgi:hypothetical protein